MSVNDPDYIPDWLKYSISVECPSCHRLMIFWQDTVSAGYSIWERRTIYKHKHCDNILPEKFSRFGSIEVICCAIEDCEACRLKYSYDWHYTGKRYAAEWSKFITVSGTEPCPKHR